MVMSCPADSVSASELRGIGGTRHRVQVTAEIEGKRPQRLAGQHLVDKAVEWGIESASFGDQDR